MATPPRRALLYGGPLLHTPPSAAPTARPVGGTRIARAGPVYVLVWRGLALSRGPLVGDLLLFVAVLRWAVSTAEGRGLVTEHGPVPTIAWTLIGGTLLYLPIGLA